MQLTQQQRSHVHEFNARYQNATTRVDFDHYCGSRLGPWSSYWFVYDYVRRFRTKTDQQLLSFGAGTGADALRFAKLGYKCYGFDISSVGIDVARKSAARYGLSSSCHFSVQTAESLDYKSEAFDIVVGIDILHHIDVGRAILEVHRVLKPGGVAIFREPLATPRRDRLRNSRLVTAVIPKGTKNLCAGTQYGDTEGEHKLDGDDFRIIREQFGTLFIERWRVLAILSVVLDCRVLLEKTDRLLFRIAPFLRRFGDQSVLIAQKAPCSLSKASTEQIFA